MIYFMLLREIVIFGIVVGGKLYVDKMLVLFIIEVGCFFYRGGSNSEYVWSDFLKD